MLGCCHNNDVYPFKIIQKMKWRLTTDAAVKPESKWNV